MYLLWKAHSQTCARANDLPNQFWRIILDHPFYEIEMFFFRYMGLETHALSAGVLITRK